MSRQTLSGVFYPENISKYSGNTSNIMYRSSWEKSFMRWCDINPDVKLWNSEEVVIPYISPVDDKPHRYFVDFLVEFQNGTKLLIEIKPHHQTQKPVPKKGKKKTTFLMEAQTYGVNYAKWKAAEKYAEVRGWKFAVFTEHTLKSLGIKIPSTLPRGKR